MSAFREEDYVTVTAQLLEVREKSLRIDNDSLRAPVWLPRASLEFVCDRLLPRQQLNAPAALRIKGDMAREKGLV